MVKRISNPNTSQEVVIVRQAVEMVTSRNGELDFPAPGWEIRRRVG